MCSACGALQPMPLWKRTDHCEKENCGLKMDRDENSARNILKRFLAGLRPHTGDPVRCADVFTATDHVNTFDHILGRQKNRIMVVDMLATYQEWKQNFLAEIDALPHTTAKGDAFVQRILQICYDLSEADAIDATECAGAGG